MLSGLLRKIGHSLRKDPMADLGVPDFSLHACAITCTGTASVLPLSQLTSRAEDSSATTGLYRSITRGRVVLRRTSSSLAGLARMLELRWTPKSKAPDGMSSRSKLANIVRHAKVLVVVPTYGMIAMRLLLVSGDEFC